MTPLKAGFAKIDITPPPGLPMAGYSDRQSEALGVHDPLWCQLMLLEDQHNLVGLIILDLIAVDEGFVRAVRQKIESGAELPGQNFIVAATHTHSGPAGTYLEKPLSQPSPQIDFFRDELSSKIADLVHQTRSNLLPAHLSVAHAQAPDVLANRLRPNGPVDHSMLILKVEDYTSRLMGVLINYSGHPTVLNHNNFLYSSDYPCYLRQAVNAEFGENVHVLFVNGAAGDVSSRFTRQASTFEEAERIGSQIGQAALKAAGHSEELHNDPLLITDHKVRLPLRKTLSIEEARQRLTEAEEKFDRLQAQNVQGSQLRLAATEVHGSKAALRRAKSPPVKPIHAYLQALCLGDLALITIPGELFASLGMIIRQNSPFPYTFVVGYANNYIGYIPSRQDYDVGGYEVRKTMLAPGAGEHLAKYAVKALYKLRDAA